MDINEKMRRARERALPPCGATVTVTGHGPMMNDEQGHTVVMVHAEPALRHAASVQAVAQLHRPDPDGFVPMCRECGKPSPCPTLAALRLDD